MAGAFRKMTDMARTADEKAEAAMPCNLAMSEARAYPYGLQITLTEAELEKLALDPECSVGDMIHGHFMARVTSVSENENEGGKSCVIGLQITHLEIEDEEDENAAEEAAEDKKPRRSLRGVY